MSIVRRNLIEQQGYAPYCGGGLSGDTRCSAPRTSWSGEQFKCPECQWVSQFPPEFIAEYKAKWHAEVKK